jgi:hypothetical protein
MSNKKKQQSDYEVGYGRPPKHGRFQPGQSGNRNGRPRSVPNLPDALLKALNESVVVSEGGKRSKITKHEAMCKQLANKGAGGDAKATRALMAWLERNTVRASTTPNVIVIQGNDAKL